MNNTRSAAHAHEFDRMDMRGESRSYEAGGGWGLGEVVPAPSAGCCGSSCTKPLYQHIGRYKVTIPASSLVA